MPPVIKMLLQNLLSNAGYIYYVNEKTTSRVVYFTFDDGPDEEFTLPVINILAKYDAKATFFLTGTSVKGSEHIVRKILEAGHGIGNHSFSHVNYTQCSYTEMVKDIEAMDSILNEFIPGKFPLIRPPYGKFRYKYLMYALLRKRKTVLWTKDYKDYNATSVKELLKNINYNKIKSGDIILMHDKSQISVDSLGKMLLELIKRGFSFRSLPGAY